MKLGNLVTYTGKYLSKAADKAAVAIGGNLVFANIKGCNDNDAKANEEVVVNGVAIKNKEAKGYYIFAGGTEALLVTKEDFKTVLRAATDRIESLEYKLADIDTVVDYVKSEISKLGTVVSFIGVVELAEGQTFNTANPVVTINSVEKTAENGDVVVVGNKEYIWESASNSWKEFGDTTVEGGRITDLENRADTLEATVSNNSTKINNLQNTLDNLDASHIPVSSIDGKEETITDVQATLNDLYVSNRVVAHSLIDLNYRIEKLNSLSNRLDIVESSLNWELLVD